jgi:transketolase
MNISQAIGTAGTASERDMANAIRFLAMDAVQAANSGHPGMPMGMADVATVLFNRFIKIDPSMPDWADRDRFVLSAGHGSMLLYAIHHLIGYSDMPMDQLQTSGNGDRRPRSSRIRPHARRRDHHRAAGAGDHDRRRHGARRGNDGGAVRRKLVDHFTYVIAGDGCLQEGISHEAIDLAGHLKLGKADRALGRQ